MFSGASPFSCTTALPAVQGCRQWKKPPWRRFTATATQSVLGPWPRMRRSSPYKALTCTIGPYEARSPLRTAARTSGPYTAQKGGEGTHKAYVDLRSVAGAEGLTQNLLGPWARTKRGGPYTELTRTLGPYTVSRPLHKAYLDLRPVAGAEGLTQSLRGPRSVRGAEGLTQSLLEPSARTTRRSPYTKLTRTLGP